MEINFGSIHNTRTWLKLTRIKCFIFKHKSTTIAGMTIEVICNEPVFLFFDK